MTDTESKEHVKSDDIVEKRVKPTVIRRRRQAKPVAPKEGVEAKVEAKAEVEVEAKVEVEVEKSEAVEAKGVQEKVPEGGKRRSLKIIAQPEEVAEEEKKQQADSLVKPTAVVKEADKFVRKTPKKKKTREELQYEDIKRQGGLKQYVMKIESDVKVTAATPEVSRVFEPGLRRRKKKPPKKGGFKKTQITEPKAIKKIIKISETITVSGMSQAMGVKVSEIIKRLIALDIMATANQSIDVDTATLLANEYGYGVESIAFSEENILEMPKTDGDGVVLESRPPVVTVMGHVDHGKTSILDIIRKEDVASGEAGGITQHIGAYTVRHGEKVVTFVDTPGHEAFTHMRARGAKVTDIVILVVAADDGVMPQTKEAIDHANAAEVPIIVAVNKIDKPNASPDKVKRELSEAGLVPEEWGGNIICVNTSASTKEGIDQLLEMVLLQAEMLELKARFSGRAEGIVIESKMDNRRGPVVTCIVKQGVLRSGDVIVSGPAVGRVKALINDKGVAVDEVFPSQPVEILGLSEVPEAGELFSVVDGEKSAKLVVESRQKNLRDNQLSRRSMVTLEDLTSQIEMGETKDLNLIVKTDVKGVADAVKDSLPGLSTKEVKINVLHTGVGGITEGDVMLASASNAVILGFNVVPDPAAREVAGREKVELKTYSVIYEMLDDVKKALVGLLKPKEVESVLGRAEVRETFKVPKAGIVAGCMVTSGLIKRSARIRLLRDNVILHDGQIVSLRRFKDDAKEVASGFECGIGIENFKDIKVGDEIEAYVIDQIEVTWEESRKE